jgi:hypothetical protein
MKNKGIIIFLTLLAVAIVVLVVLDVRNNRTDLRPDNPYDIGLDQYSTVDSSLIQYREVLNLSLNEAEKKGIAFGLNKLWVIGADYLQSITPEGSPVFKKELDKTPSSITIYQSDIYIAFTDEIRIMGEDGTQKRSWPVKGDSILITGMAANDSLLYAADAGRRKVLKFRTDGTLLAEFDGKRETGDLHGFIIPSPYFDLAFAPDGELWVVNPGKHALENYTPQGRLRGYWSKSSAGIDGFSGCCGPAQIAILPDGSFVTAEKGLVRIKVHHPNGDLSSVVGPPSKFQGGTHAPDLATDGTGVIYALDFDQKIIRVFEKIEQ